jgi:hypothetical protein
MINAGPPDELEGLSIRFGRITSNCERIKRAERRRISGSFRRWCGSFFANA